MQWLLRGSARTVRALHQVSEQLLEERVYRERSSRWYLVGSEAVPFSPGGLWMVADTEQPRARTARAPRLIGGVIAQRGHSVGTAPIFTVFIRGTPLQTTPLQKRA